MCNDPFIGYLKQFGYSVIRLPRRDFRPLQILARQGKDLNTLGELATVIVPGQGAASPPVKPNTPAAAISGQKTSDLSLGVGLTILGSIIGAMGGGNLGLDAKYQRAKTIAFEFHDVLMDSVEIAALDQFLGASDINPHSRHVAELLEADEVYVVTATIKSNQLTVGAKGQGGARIEVSVPEIQQVVGAKVNVAGSGNQSTNVTYKSAEPLVFAFQAVQLFYDQGHYTAFEPLESGQLAARSLGTPLPQGIKAFQSASAFARLGTS